MSLIQSVLLGALQGITEFLPVSSSGHLQVVQHLFNLEEVPLLFDVCLHISTLLAVFIFFRKTICGFFAILYRWIFKKQVSENKEAVNGLCVTEEAGRKTIIAVLITTAITGIMGIVSSKIIPELPVKFVFIGFLITSAFLILSAVFSKSQVQKEYSGITIRQSVIVGIFQGIGTLPGISRSGSTISSALFSGVNRELAGEYSFIVSIPAILGAFVREVKELDKMNSAIGILPLVLGCLASFAVGYFALAVLMKIIKKGKLEWFAAYLIPAAILGLIFIK